MKRFFLLAAVSLLPLGLQAKSEAAHKSVQSKVVHISSESDFNKLANGSLPVLVDFYADWCGPCRKLADSVEKLAQEFAGKIVVVKVNTDNYPGIAKSFKVKGIPALHIVRNGESKAQSIGLKPYDELKKFVEANS